MNFHKFCTINHLLGKCYHPLEDVEIQYDVVGHMSDTKWYLRGLVKLNSDKYMCCVERINDVICIVFGHVIIAYHYLYELITFKIT